MVLEINITNWDKYNARNDVKSCTWFRMSNDFFVDPEFYGASSGTRMVWLYLLCCASKKNNSTVKINVQMMVDAIKLDVLSIEKALFELENIGCVTKNANSMISTRSDSIVRKMFPSATDRQTDRQTHEQNASAFVIDDFVIHESGWIDFDATPWLLPISDTPKKNLPETQTQENPKPAIETAEKRSRSVHKKLSESGNYVAPEFLVIEYFNSVNNRNLKQVNSNYKEIKARIKEGFTVEEMKTLIDHAAKVWSKDAFWERLNRPSTLFGGKFNQYL
jgi:uncharacterized phage protein (TIGR02220 family)